MKTYVIKLTIQEKIEAYYIIEANNIICAKNKIKKAFLTEFPNADFSVIRMSLDNPTTETLKEVLEIIKKEGMKKVYI